MEALPSAAERHDAELAQATALYRAGASEKARVILDEMPDDSLTGVAALEVLVLALEVDSDLGIERSDHHRGRWRRRVSYESESESPCTDAGFAWINVFSIGHRKGRRQFRSMVDRVENVLSARADQDVRARALLARFCADLVPTLVELGDCEASSAAAEKAATLVAGRSGVPADVRALAQINRAFVAASSPSTLARTAPYRQAAHTLALAHGLPRILWKSLYLHEFESIWRGDAQAALRDARILSASVAASDSRAWRRIVRSQLANAYTLSGDLSAAESAVADMAAEHEEDAALHSCKLAYVQGRDADAVARAQSLTSYTYVPNSVRANVLLYSAAAAYRLADEKRAANDIDSAIALLESSSLPALFITQRVYALAHRITGRRRFGDIASEIQSAFVRAQSEAATTTIARALTGRQREVAELAAGGATNRTIADNLGISSRTVGNHLGVAFDVLGIRARWQLREALRDLQAETQFDTPDEG